MDFGQYNHSFIILDFIKYKNQRKDKKRNFADKKVDSLTYVSINNFIFHEIMSKFRLLTVGGINKSLLMMELLTAAQSV